MAPRSAPAAAGPDPEPLLTILALARQGAPARAARERGISLSTAYRHLAAAEEAFGRVLFERAPGAWRPTAAAAPVLAAADAMERARADLAALAGAAPREGPRRLRVSLSEACASFYVAGLLPRLRERHPGIEVDLVVDDALADLGREAVDVAVRPVHAPGDALWGRRAARMAHAVYGAPKLVRAEAPVGPADLAGRPVLGYGEALAAFDPARWLERLDPAPRIVARFGSVSAMVAAARVGLGLAVLPCFVGERCGGLARAFGPIPGLDVDVWLVAHAARRGDPAVRGFLAFLHARLREDAGLMGGLAPGPGAAELGAREGGA